MTADHNALRGSSPGQNFASENGLACGGARIDSLCIKVLLPFQHSVTPGVGVISLRSLCDGFLERSVRAAHLDDCGDIPLTIYLRMLEHAASGVHYARVRNLMIAIDRTTTNDVVVVVIGRNEGERLVKCLDSITVEPGSVVYVDSGSSDRSVSEAEKHGILVVRLDMLLPFTAARARNEGFAASRKLKPNARFVQFVDGDCELDPLWLSTALQFMIERRTVAVVCGRRRERSPEASIYNRLCDIEWNTPIGEASFCGGDSLVRIEAFEAVGGYQARLIAGEEPELCTRLREKGWKIWRIDANMTLHDAAITRFGQWWTRAVRGGYGAADVSCLLKSSRFDLFASQIRRAVIWGGVIPLFITALAFFHPVALLATAAYPFEVVRIAMRSNRHSQIRWTYAAMLTIARFAELQGILKYAYHRLRGSASKLIEYKKPI